MNSLLVGNQQQLKLLITANSRIQDLDIRSSMNIEVLVASGSALKKLLVGKRSSIKTLLINNTRVLIVNMSHVSALEYYNISGSAIICADIRGNASSIKTICNPN